MITPATSVAAKLLRMQGEIGEIMPGAFADLLIVDGDPTRDLTVFREDGSALVAIMRNGRFFKNELR